VGPEQVLGAGSLNYASSGALVFPSEAIVATVALRIRQALLQLFMQGEAGKEPREALPPPPAVRFFLE